MCTRIVRESCSKSANSKSTKPFVRIPACTRLHLKHGLLARRACVSTQVLDLTAGSFHCTLFPRGNYGLSINAAGSTVAGGGLGRPSAIMAQFTQLHDERLAFTALALCPSTDVVACAGPENTLHILVGCIHPRQYCTAHTQLQAAQSLRPPLLQLTSTDSLAAVVRVATGDFNRAASAREGGKSGVVAGWCVSSPRCCQRPVCATLRDMRENGLQPRRFAAGTCNHRFAGKHLVLCTAGGGISVLHVESVSRCEALD